MSATENQQSNSLTLPTFPSACALLTRKEEKGWAGKIRKDNSTGQGACHPGSGFIWDPAPHSPPTHFSHSRSSRFLTGTEIAIIIYIDNKCTNRPFPPLLLFLSISFLLSLGSHSIKHLILLCLWLLPLCGQALVKTSAHLILPSHLLFFCLPPWPSSFLIPHILPRRS